MIMKLYICHLRNLKLAARKELQRPDAPPRLPHGLRRGAAALAVLGVPGLTSGWPPTDSDTLPINSVHPLDPQALP